jgi:1-deoxy-D-xylulose-5-phosphate reductoisomerase
MKRVVVLGSTGSIGTQTLDVISQHRDHLQVVGLAAHTNGAKLQEQADQYKVKHTALYKDGIDGIIRLATSAQADIVVISVAGVIGLIPTIEAIKAGKQIALASKEVLVAAGEIVMPLLQEHNTTLTPIDSEHSAIFQCLQGYRPEQVENLYLTASGGPFRGKKRNDLQNVTKEQALNHPTWNMGGKITVDSATLMNKGLEAIEAKWLFGLDVDQVEVVIHPQSVIHSMVKFNDGSVLGQLGWPDMRLPISYALLYPERLPNKLPPWNPMDTPSLTFEEVDHDTFPSINLAKAAARTGGTMACVMNAANEEAANSFLRGEVSFLRIPEIVELAMSQHRPEPATMQTVLEADAQTRQFVRKHIDTAQR